VRGALTDGGQGGRIEAKTIITTIGTRFNMPYLAVLTDMAKQPAQESIVANRRTIAHKCDMPPCPSNGYVHAPIVTKEPYRAHGVRPNLTGLANKHHFSLQYRSTGWDKKKGVPCYFIHAWFMKFGSKHCHLHKSERGQNKGVFLPLIWRPHLPPFPGSYLWLTPQPQKPLDILPVYLLTVVLAQCKAIEQQWKLERPLHRLV
jgi:hypothetical protein